MKLILRKLIIRNFKGITTLAINFQDITNISGYNGTGKTTIFDAFTWLLFGKDSLDREKFNIKTLDGAGSAIPQIEHEVEGLLEVYKDDEPLPIKYILRRTLKELWVKPRGKAEAEMQGHETTYFINGVPHTQKDYNKFVADLCNETIFKLITNPRYFPTQNWKVQRGTLMKLIPETAWNDKKVLEAYPGKFPKLFDLLMGKTLEQYRKELANEKERIRKQLEQIPVRIDETNKSIPAETFEEVFSKIIYEDVLAGMNEEIRKVDELLQDKSKAVDQAYQTRMDLRNKINEKTIKGDRIKFDLIQELKGEPIRLQAQEKHLIDRAVLLENGMLDITGALENSRRAVTLGEEARTDLLAKYQEITAEQFSMDENDVYCPMCKQELPAGMKLDKIDQLMQDFNKDKDKRTKANVAAGLALKEKLERDRAVITRLEKDIQEASTRKEEVEKELKVITEKLKKHLETDYIVLAGQLLTGKVKNAKAERELSINTWRDIQTYITKAEEELTNITEAGTDNTEFQEQKKGFVKEKDEFTQKHEVWSNVRKARLRIEELKKQQKELSQALADLELVEFLADEFVIAKITMLEDAINNQFSLVKFKMFNTLLNGAIEEACELTINGVPYSDLNNAGRINAGLDVINTISSVNDIFAPVFIDNREAVIDLYAPDTQIINLIVTKDKELIITYSA